MAFPFTVKGGWDKCRGPFTHYEAKAHGIDVWDCHSNCYTRRDPNGGKNSISECNTVVPNEGNCS